MNSKVLLLTTAALLAPALASQALAGPDLKAAADDVCNCMAEPNRVAAEGIELLKKAQASGDFSQVMMAQGKVMGVMSAAKNCFEKLPAKYPAIDKNDALKEKVMAMANQQCPNPAKDFMAPK